FFNFTDLFLVQVDRDNTFCPRPFSPGQNAIAGQPAMYSRTNFYNGLAVNLIEQSRCLPQRRCRRVSRLPESIAANSYQHKQVRNLRNEKRWVCRRFLQSNSTPFMSAREARASGRFFLSQRDRNNSERRRTRCRRPSHESLSRQRRGIAQ